MSNQSNSLKGYNCMFGNTEKVRAPWTHQYKREKRKSLGCSHFTYCHSFQINTNMERLERFWSLQHLVSCGTLWHLLPCLHSFQADNTCFDIDTVQAQSGLQRQKRGMQIPQSPFLFQAQGTQTLPKDCTLQRALLST